MARSYVAVIVLIFSSVLWGLSWLPLKGLHKLGIEGLPLMLISYTMLVALFFYPGWVKGKHLRVNALPLAAIAVLGGAAIVCFTCALIYGDVIRVMVLFYLLPVWGVLGGMFFLGEKPDSIRWLGVVLAVFGAVLVLGGLDILTAPPTWLDLLAVLSGLFFAANNLCFRGVSEVPLASKLFFMLFGCAVLSGGLLLAGVSHFPAAITEPMLGWIAVYSLCWLLFANVGSQWAVTQMEAGKSSIIIIVELVAAVISALLLGEESLSTIEWLGCTMVVAAALLEAFRDAKTEVTTSVGC